MRKPSDYVQTCKEFKAVFGLDFRQYIDTCFFGFGEVAVDIVKFGDWLEAEHYNGAMGSTSIQEAVQAKFGERGLRLITDLM